MTFAFLTVPSLALALLSPLCTFLRLFQIKEWRTDRLAEHLRREGYVSQLFSVPRLLVLGLGLVGIVLGAPGTFFLLLLEALALLSVIQLATRRQPMPVWTSKARIIGAIAVALSLGSLWIGTGMPLLPVLIAVCQPAFALIAWLAFLPADRMMKARVFAAASALRDTMGTDAVVIGIAGSVGKTTTKELLGHLLQDLSPLVTPAHVNTEMGVAQWLLARKADIVPGKPLVIEMGAYAKGEIKLLAGVVRPTLGVMTALGSDHLALFGSEEAIVDANAELIEALPAHGHAFLNGDNEAARGLASRATCQTALVGTHEGDAWLALDITEGTDGLRFRTNDREFQVPLRGRHHVTNVLLAMSVAAYLQVPLARIRELLATFRPLRHTFNVLEENGVTILDDTYNVSPLSFRAALDWSAARPEETKVLLTSGLLELGKDEAAFLQDLGAKASFFDRVIFTTPSGKDAFEAAYGKTVELLSDAAATIEPGTLLACVGRMPISSIRRLLP